MEKQYKIGETLLKVKGVKADIERITDQIRRLTGIKGYVVEKYGILGGEENSTTFMTMFIENPLREPEQFEIKKEEYLKQLSSKIITVVDYPEIRVKVQELFDAHVCIRDNRKTPEQKEAETIERNRIEKEHEAKREEERTKTDQEKEGLKKEYSYLTLVSGSGLSSRIMATKNIRKELDKHFPGLMFSIKSESYSGGDSINVNWTDGATRDEVEKIAKKYQEGHFDGMNDIYEYGDRAFNDLFGGVKYLFCNRSLTTESYIETAKELGYTDSLLIDKEKDIWEITGIDDAGKARDIREMIIREAYQKSFYTKPAENSTIEVSAEGTENPSGEVIIIENKLHNGIELKFNQKPDQETIDYLKSNKFRWNPRTKVWYSKKTEFTVRLSNALAATRNGRGANNQQTISNPEEGLETESYQNFERGLQEESRSEVNA